MGIAQTGGANNQGIECRLVASPTEVCVGDSVFFAISNIGSSGPDSCVSPFVINTVAASATFYPFSGHPGFPLPINVSSAVWSDIGFVYTQPGVYNPYLEIITTAGLTSFEPIFMYANNGFVDPAVITVSDGPDVSLSQNSLTDCFWLTGGLINLSAYLNYPSASLNVNSQVDIDWGDGTTGTYVYNGSSWPAMEHYFPNPGSYTIEITVSDNCGDTTLYFNYTTDEMNAEFTYNSTCDLGNDVIFQHDNACLSQYNNITYNWYFGDGTQLLGTTQSNPIHTYPGQGTYTVVLEVIAGNTTYTYSQSVDVLGVPVLNVALNVNNTCNEGPILVDFSNSFSFTGGSGLTIANDYNGIVLSFQQDPVFTPQYYLEVSGPGLIQLQALDSNGCAAYTTIEIFDCCSKVYDKFTITPIGDYGTYDTTFTGSGPADYIFNNVDLTTYIANGGNFPANGVISDAFIEINGLFAVSQDLTFERCQVFLGPDAEVWIKQDVEFKTFHSHFQACDTVLWKRIHADEPSARIYGEYSIFREAQQAISVVNGAQLSLQFSRFEASHTGIYIGDFQPGVISGATPYPILLEQNVFYTEYPAPGNAYPLLYPYYNLEPQYGIHVNQVGYTELSFNDYFRCKYGIYAQNSSIKVEGSNFYNHTNNAGSVSAKGARVGIRGENTMYFSPDPFIEVNMTGALGTMNFINNDIGIYTTNNRVHVDEVQFTDNQTSIRVINPDKNTILEKNQIEGGNTGIIAQNVFEETVNLSIRNNQITTERYGIRATNLRSNKLQQTRIADNDIYFNGDEPGMYRVGVHIEACAKIIAKHNLVQKNSNLIPSEYAFLYGIFLSESEGARVFENTLREMGNGIRCIGYLGDAELYCNDIDGSNYGVYLVPPSPVSTTFMTDQRTQGHGQMNYITGNIQINSVGGQNTANPIPNWYFHSGASGGYVYNVAQLAFNGPNSAPVTTCNESIPVPPGPGGGTLGGDTTSPLPTEYAMDVATDSLEFAALEQEMEYKSETHVYRELEEGAMPAGSSPGDSTVLVNFMQQVQQTDIGLWEEYTTALADGRIDTSSVYLELMNATGNIEQNMRTTGQAYQQAYAFGNAFDATTEQTLQTIALQTPYVGGRGVYSARVMLDIDNWMYDLPYKTDPNEMQDSEEERTVKLYPVPAERDLMIQWTEKSSAHIVVYDIRGMAVLEQDANDTGSVMLDVSGLAKGVYILSLEYTDGTTEAHRLILGK